MPDYPAAPAERRRIRDRKAAAGAAQGRVHALSLVTSLKCSGYGFGNSGRHEGFPGGCANDGTTCLCECHDRQKNDPGVAT